MKEFLGKQRNSKESLRKVKESLRKVQGNKGFLKENKKLRDGILFKKGLHNVIARELHHATPFNINLQDVIIFDMEINNIILLAKDLRNAIFFSRKQCKRFPKSFTLGACALEFPQGFALGGGRCLKVPKNLALGEGPVPQNFLRDLL